MEGCSGCGDCIEIIDLAQGPTGPQGIPGAAGADGADGADGQEGTTILYNDPTNVGTINGVVTQDLQTYILGPSLNADLDAIEIEAWVEDTSIAGVINPPQYQIALLFGATVIGYVEWTRGISKKQAHIKALMSRVNQNLQRIQYEQSVSGYKTTPNSAVVGLDSLEKGKIATAVDLSSGDNIILRVSVTTGTFALNELVCTQFLIKNLKN